MNRLLALAFLAFTLIVSALSARADTFTFSYIGANISASGKIDAVNQGNGQYLVDAISGTRDGVAVLSLDPVNAFGSNDNLLNLTSATTFSFSGLSFQTVDGTQYNVYTSGGIDKETLSGFDDGAAITFDLSPASAPTPEPATLVLLGTGLAGMAGAIRRRHLRG